jgi:ornithine lipid ester-linked acyl 2-hydroxylase
MTTTEYTWPQGEELVYVRPPVEEYHGKLDYFYSPDLFPELAPLKENWKEIRDEILRYEQNSGVLSGTSIYTVPPTAGGEWTVKYLMSFMMKYHKNRKDFPFICSIVDKIPNIVFTSISILSPHTEIKPHYGDTNGIVRAHLGLIIPAPYPTIAMRVGDEERGWQEGELLCFINVQRHSVWNRSSGRRYVLMVDFVPKNLEHRQMEICAKGLGSQSFIIVYNKIPFVKHLPAFVHTFMVQVASLFWRLFLPIQRRLSIL